jgi:glutamate 5-kinase
MTEYNTIVIKIGSSTLTTKEGKLDVSNLTRLVFETAGLVKQKLKIIIVTSGAVVTGTERLNLKSKPTTVPQKQAAAAVGQSILMRQYEKAFEKYGITVAQVLLTRDAIADRERYLNARNTISTLLAENVVPIVNENDTVAVEEIKVGDNDTLSALVASLIGADLLVLLTDVDGFYMETDEGVDYRVDVVEEITKEVAAAAGHPGTQLGTGGMVTKISAARICQDAGIPVVIAHGRTEGIIEKIVNGEKVGTLIKPKAKKPESKKRWVAHGLPIKGTVTVDAGAEAALIKNGSSLLPAGIKSVAGKFKIGEVLSIVDLSGREIGRGLSNYSSEELTAIKGKKSKEISPILGYEGNIEAIHRDNMVIL